MISIVVPTYNEEKNVGRCLESLLRQTIPKKDYEIIVVDGHSKDKTVSIAKKYADKVIYQTSKGVGGARNDGVKISKYDLIATTDADCVIPENWLEVIIENLSKDRIVCVYGQQKPLEDSFKNRFGLKCYNLLMHTMYFFNIYMTVGANMAFRKKDFLELGGYKSYSAGDDFEIPLRLRKKGKIGFSTKMEVWFSMRRYEKGAIIPILNWFLNFLKSKYNLRINIESYTQKEYKN